MRSLQSKIRVSPPDGDFIFGRIKDRTSSNRGTPVNEELYGDFHQFFEKLMSSGDITANGLPDCEYTGFQLFQALLKVSNKYNAAPLAKALIGGYTSGDLIILDGLEVTISTVTNPDDTATWTEGAVFYNDAVYLVSAGTLTKSTGVFLYMIDDEDDSLITISSGSSGDGLADYGDSNVKGVVLINGTGFSLQSSTNLTSASLRIGRVMRRGKSLTFSFTLLGTTILNQGFNWTVSIPAAFKPKQSSIFPGAATFNNLTDGVSLSHTQGDEDAFGMNIDSNGRLFIGYGADLAIGTSKIVKVTCQFTCEAV